MSTYSHTVQQRKGKQLTLNEEVQGLTGRVPEPQTGANFILLPLPPTNDPLQQEAKLGMTLGQGVVCLATIAYKKVHIANRSSTHSGSSHSSSFEYKTKMSISTRENWRERNEVYSNGTVSLLQSRQPMLLPPSGKWIILAVGQLCPQQIPFMRWAGKSLPSE